MLDFNFNSNHIEGNTLTYGQTEVLLLLGQVIGTAKMKDLEEMKAHNICLTMVEQAAVTEEPLTETFIRQIHQVCCVRIIRYIVNYQVEKVQVILFMPDDTKLAPILL